MADRGRAVALGRAGRERAATSFTWDGIADTLAGYYESLLGRPTRSRVEISRVARGRRACGVLIADQNRKVVPARTSSGVPIFVIPPPMLGEALARPSGTRT